MDVALWQRHSLSEWLRMVSSLFYVGLATVGAPGLARRLRHGGTILCYHNVVAGDGADDAVHMPLAKFATQAAWLARHYEVVPLREFVDRVMCGAPLGRVAALTFDDGYAGVFEHAVPVLADLGIPATVFVIAEAPGDSGAFWWDHPDLPGSLTKGQRGWLQRDLQGSRAAIYAAARLGNRPPPTRSHRAAEWSVIAAGARRGIEIGVHSATHRTLPRLGEHDLEREVVGSREVIEREIGVRPEFFAYPYGMWDERVRAAVRAAGYRAAVTLDPGLNRAGADPWALRRINVPAGIGSAAFRAWTAGLNPRWALGGRTGG